MRRSIRPLLVLWLLLAACNQKIEPSYAIPSPAATLVSQLEPTGPALPEEPPSPTAVQPIPQNTPAATHQIIVSPTLPASVIRFPDPAAYAWTKAVAGFRFPLYLSSSGDGSGRIFVVTQPGQVWIIQDGAVFKQPFLDLGDRVTSPGGNGRYGERGLLGLAFHPDYAHNGFFYVNYTDRDGNTIVARYVVSQDPDLADPQSEQRMLLVEQPYPNHNGGMLAFGPDGDLYIALGDGGSAGDPEGNAQSLDTLLGKILRIDVDRAESYAIPASNPFAQGGGAPEIWVYGLRNPWRFSFDAATGDLYIGDVGQNQWEEVNFLPAGEGGGVNFGWDYREGLHAYEGEPPAGMPLVDPIFEYSHAQGCSLTGGYVYRGSTLPEWQGVYLAGDYCTGLVWGLLRDNNGNWQSQLLFQTGFTIASFGQDQAGEIYVIDYAGGGIFRLEKHQDSP